MQENCINETKNSYLLNMSKKENKINTNENENNITVEYGEQDLKPILLQAIKQEYINYYKKDNIISSQKESNIKPMENMELDI